MNDKAEVVDRTTGEVVAYEPPQGSADPAGVAALANLPEDQFQQRLAVMKAGRARVEEIKTSLMKQGTDYGLIPGTGDKPTLLKPGAEKLAEFYRLAAEMLVNERHGDGIVAPLICYVVQCRLHLHTMDGPVVATGWGVCSNWERKYRYRSGKENADPHEQANTVLKMAEKRAFVDAVLRATASSSLFTQDLEDMYADQQADRSARQGASAEAGAQAPQRAAQAATADDGPGSVCPKHNRTWKQNRRGYYCSSRDDSQEGGFCTLKPSREWAAAQEMA